MHWSSLVYMIIINCHKYLYTTWKTKYSGQMIKFESWSWNKRPRYVTEHRTNDKGQSPHVCLFISTCRCRKTITTITNTNNNHVPVESSSHKFLLYRFPQGRRTYYYFFFLFIIVYYFYDCLQSGWWRWPKENTIVPGYGR